VGAAVARINISGWPVMAAMCASCPFREDGAIEVRNSVISRIAGMQASQVCHHPRTKGKRQTHLCRGARDFQLTILYRMGMIAAPTDHAFREASERHG
jgi:hypothetical protein